MSTRSVGGLGATAGEAGGVDAVTLTVAANHLVAISEEMGLAMKRTAYSPLFSEANDFSCAVFDADGEMIGQGNFCPAQLGAMMFALRWIIDDRGIEAFGPDDVFLHNDPYSGMNHLPEHMVVKAVFSGKERVGIVACIGHMAEVGGLAAGGFPGDAQEVFHEGLRLPPVRIVKARVEDADLWRIILANNRTPRVSQGDLRAMIGSLHVGAERLLRFAERHGVCSASGSHRGSQVARRGADPQRRSRRTSGTYVADKYIIDNDGWVDEPVRVRVAVTIADGRLDRGLHRQRPAVPRLLQLHLGRDDRRGLLRGTPHHRRRHPCQRRANRPVDVIAPEGRSSTPPTVGDGGGNSEVQPHLVTLIWKAIAPAVPA